MRKTFDEDAPPLPPGGVMPLPMQRQMPCMICGEQTPHETLSNFGARCGRCFTAYCKAAFDDEANAARYKVGLARGKRAG